MIKKLFDIQDMRNGNPVFCRGICFYPTKIEEKSSYILAEIVAIEKNKFTAKFDKSGRFWGDSNQSAFDLCTKVIDDDGFDVTEKFLKETQRSTCRAI